MRTLVAVSILLGSCSSFDNACRERPHDDEVCVAGGAFQFGHPDDAHHRGAQPRAVTVAPYFIDRFPVTNAQYKQCVAAGACPNECQKAGTCFGPFYSAYHLDDPALQNHPMATLASHAAAEAYCRWKARRLPSEVEWERAARGNSATDFPWGAELPAELAKPHRPFVPVGTHARDRSPEGVRDLVTGVPEAVSDWYDPLGRPSSSGTSHVVRGRFLIPGDDQSPFLHPAWARRGGDVGIGFRCARDAKKAPSEKHSALAVEGVAFASGADTGPSIYGKASCTGGDFHSPDGSPPDVPDQGLCFNCNASHGLQPSACEGCACSLYFGQFPDGVFDSGGATGCYGMFGCEQAGDNDNAACQPTTVLAAPQCSNGAEAAGFVGETGEPAVQPDVKGIASDGADGDYTINLCPDFQQTWIGDRHELRDESNFIMSGFYFQDHIKAEGAIHVEVQDCRLYDGSYTFDPGDGTKEVMAARPHANDSVSVSGDWVGDIGHHPRGARDSPYAEIHEAELIAVVRQSKARHTVHFALLNAFFVRGYAQDELELDIEIPGLGSSNYELHCSIDDTVTNTQSPRCPPKRGVSVTIFPAMGNFCHVIVDRVSSNSEIVEEEPALPWGCGNVEACKNSDGNPLTFVGRIHARQDACDQIFYAGAIRAEFLPPAPPPKSTGCSYTP